MRELLFPRICTGCGKKGAYLCSSCRKQLIPHPELCPICHRPSRGGSVCCEKNALSGVVVGFSYDRLLKPLLLALKYRHAHDVVDCLIGRLSLLLQAHGELGSLLAQHGLVFSWVPSHWWKRWFVKGYNQSEFLARALANSLGASVLPLTKKTRWTRSQTKLGRKQRFQNLSGAFLARSEVSSLASGTTVVLVDDLLTTGATLDAVAKAIVNVRPDVKIWGLVMARKMG